MFSYLDKFYFIENKIKIHRYKYFFFFFIISFSSFLYVDYFSFTFLGILVSFILFLILVALSVYKLSFGIVTTLFVSLYINEFPRDILNLYSDIQVTNSVQYNVISSVIVLKLTLLNLLFIFNSFLSLLKLWKNKFNKMNLLLVIYVVIGMTSLLVSLLFYENTIFKSIITDLKFPIFLLFGLIQGLYLYKNSAIHLVLIMILVLPIFGGIRALIFITNDIYFMTPKFYFMSTSMMALVILSYLIISKNKSIYSYIIFRVPLYISLIEPSRGFIIMASIVLSFSFIVSFFKKGNNNISLFIMLELFLILMGALLTLLVLNPDIYGFLIWKLDVFNELLSASNELSGSGKVRIYELLNVHRENMDSIYQYFFGKGFGGFYSFNYYPMNDVETLDLKSFSNDQLQTNMYYTTHSFSTYMLLKYGMVGLVIYVLIPIFIIWNSFKHTIKNNLHIIFLVFTILSIYTYYWRLEITVMIGIFFAFYNEFKRKKLHEI